MSKINLEKFSKEELQNLVSESYDKTELCSKLGINYSNGKVNKKVLDYINSLNISTDHFDKSKKNRARRKYPIVKKNCPVCNKEFKTQQGGKEERITCSLSCSNTYFAASRHTIEANIKTSESLHKFHENNGTSRKIFNKSCKECLINFQSFKEDQVYCSTKCSALAKWKNENYRTNLVFQVNERVRLGIHKGWSGRSKLKPSFPESVTIEILKELNIELQRELKVGSWFIDFADVNRKISIEIDGKQHEEPIRKNKDLIKDTYLISQGWKVFRIKWKKLTKEFREEVKNKLIEILSEPDV
jgi:very-short-patch-repair endonuclease